MRVPDRPRMEKAAKITELKIVLNKITLKKTLNKIVTRMSQISPIMAARCLMFIHREIKYSQNRMVYRLLRASDEMRQSYHGHPKHIHQQTLPTRCILALHFAIKYSNKLPCTTLGICSISQMIPYINNR